MTNVEIIKMLVNAMDTNGVQDEALKQAAIALLDNLKVAPKADKAKTVEAVKAEPKSAGRKGIDHGKILALNEAGWSVAKIVDELGTTSVTVRNHLKKEATA